MSCASSKSKLTICHEFEFWNDPCFGILRNGTCYTLAECVTLGGFPEGLCAGGHGVCCIKIIDGMRGLHHP